MTVDGHIMHVINTYNPASLAATCPDMAVMDKC